MKQNQLIQKIEAGFLKKNIPAFRVGDTLAIHQRIIEGEKERIQIFTGTLVARKGAGLAESITLYRFSYGSGIERVFSIHSPRIAKIEVVRSGKVRKGKLYYICGKSGKGSKIEEQIGGAKEAAIEAPEAEPAT